MGITAAQIAKMCKVSRTTVDRALKNKPGISPQTGQKIREIAEKYGYKPNYLASSLSTGKTRSVGVIVFDLYNQHFSYMVNAIEKYFAEQGIFAYVCISEKNKQRELEIIDDLYTRKVDGILLVPINDGPEFTEHLRSLNIPVLPVSNRLEGFPFVSGDAEKGAYEGMQFFYDHGYRTVYFVCPPMRRIGKENLYGQEIRVRGYQRFLAEHPEMQGELIVSSDYLDQVEALVVNASERIGVFCSSDIFTLSIRKRLIECGLDLDSCCYLMGFDGLDFLSQLNVRPASVVYPAEDIGRAAAKMLLDMINNRAESQEILLPCPLIPGSGKV